MKGVYASLVWMDGVRALHNRDTVLVMGRAWCLPPTRMVWIRANAWCVHYTSSSYSHEIISGVSIINVKLLVRPYILVCDIWLFFELLARISVCARRMEPVCASIPSRSTSSKCPHLGVGMILSSARDSSHERVVRDARPIIGFSMSIQIRGYTHTCIELHTNTKK